MKTPDTENPHIHSLLFISGTMHSEMLLHCQGALSEESQAPFPLVTMPLRYVSTSTSLLFKAGNHSSKNQVFSGSIHNNTSAVSKPCPLKLCKAILEMSFSGAPCSGASAKGGAGYANPLHQDSSLRERHHCRESHLSPTITGHERGESLPPFSSATACFSNRRWNFQEVTLQTTSLFQSTGRT